MTLMDKVDEFLATYVRRSKSPELPTRAEDDLPFSPDDYSSETEKFSMSVNGKELNPELRRRMALTTPFYMKGLKKKSRDTFRAGWTYNRFKDNKQPTKVEMKLLRDFNRRSGIKEFLVKMKQDAHVYGDGMGLIIFKNDQKNRKPDIAKPISKTAEPYKLKRLNPEHINEMVYKNEAYKDKGILHYVYEDEENMKKVLIHPDRILHFKETDFAFSMFGISDIDVLRHVISSEADIDIATGSVLKWFAYGILEWKKDGLKPNEKREMIRTAEGHPHIYVTNEKYSMNVHNPEAIDPAPFYDYIIMSIATVLVMPTHVLKGITVGQTTGAEIGYTDYFKDIYDSQELVYKPHLDRLYTLLFKAYNKRFDYDITFNPVYVGELAEAEVDGKRAATAVNLRAAGIISNEEARRTYNEGHIYLKPDKEIESISDSGDDKEPVEQNPRTEQPVKKQEADKNKSKDKKLKQMKSMIEARKIRTDIESRSEFESKSQEKRFKAAQEKRLKEIKERIRRLGLNE